MQIYEAQGYSQRDAAQSILTHNLFGLDIDDRAAQMAYFAVMMKARQYDRRILTRGIKPHIYAIQESNHVNRHQLQYFGIGMNEFEKNTAINEMEGLLDILNDAKEYGSILNVDNYDWNLLRRFAENADTEGQMSFGSVNLNDTQEMLLQLIEIGQVLAQKYDVVVTNPPYMGSSGMGTKLSEFVKKNYPDTKSDMSTVCMEKTISMCKGNGYMAMINIPVWMFLSSYETLRNHMIANNTIVNMVHPGRGVFGSDFGAVTFVIGKNHVTGYKGQYRRLFDKQGEVKSVEEREQVFFDGVGKFTAQQDNFSKIPGSPVAYWVGKKVIEAFQNKCISDYGQTKNGMTTGCNDIFMRRWYEISYMNSAYTVSSLEEAKYSRAKWFPYNKGGELRKWYGNMDFVLNWENDGMELKSFGNSILRNQQFYFRPCITWSLTNSSGFGARLRPTGSLFDVNGMSFFTSNDIYYLLGIMNSAISSYAMRIINPTISNQAGNIDKIPVVVDESKKKNVDDLVLYNIQFSKADWDSFETSWDFQRHPLVALAHKTTYKSNGVPAYRIEDAFDWWNNECETRFTQLKANEEELNRIFIDIYGLQDELTPEVEDKDVTVRKADLQRDIKSLLSYAVGCMFGRYSLDVEGLAYAGGNWEPDKYRSFQPDDDNIIPITDEEYLEDDIVTRFCEWLKVVYGEGTLEENLDFIAKALGNKGNSSREIIRNYFLNDFFKDHCQTYSVTGSGKRPIYWLFDSGKQNGFKALIYLHRYNADTIGNLRIDYLHRMQRVYESEMNRMQDMIDHATSSREVTVATKRKEKLTKQLKECRDYDEKIAHLALSRIELDLDDGVKVNYEKVQTASDGKKYQVLAKI
jgi:hypothetical protein